ncbi:SDR family oxidoreductase [Ruminococcaceae bacterium OttesenSCG-928-I18]|nr:SDR family oxidoreductase [Ruminococcaceae bacterium OttesenSCG-928-I18]
MLFSLKGKNALVTGAAQGVGLAVTKRFLDAEIDHVVMLDLNGELGQKEADKLGDRVEFYQLDVTDEKAVIKMMDYVKGKYGKVDIVSNNAGVIFADTKIEDLSVAEMQKCINVNYIGYFMMIKYALPLMPDFSSIVNICSIAGIHAFPGYTSYNGSKGAIKLLTESVALELADRGIRCNAISPASISGPMVEQPGCEAELAMAKYLPPLGRLCEPEEVAAAVHFLASDDTKFITAVNLPVDGGVTGVCYGRNTERKLLEDLDL